MSELLVVANGLACNGHLRDAVQQWAFCSLGGSDWAREFYGTHRAKGNANTPPASPREPLARGPLALPHPQRCS